MLFITVVVTTIHYSSNVLQNGLEAFQYGVLGHAKFGVTLLNIVCNFCNKLICNSRYLELHYTIGLCMCNPCNKVICNRGYSELDSASET